MGSWPKKRLYSRLNWLALSYPTSKAALAASARVCELFGTMAKTYRSYLPEQDLLLPPSLREWLPDDHLAYFVFDVVDQLNLSAIESVYEEDDRGQLPYYPRMMTKILLSW
jgi:hypothetical protein